MGGLLPGAGLQKGLDRGVLFVEGGDWGFQRGQGFEDAGFQRCLGCLGIGAAFQLGDALLGFLLVLLERGAGGAIIFEAVHAVQVGIAEAGELLVVLLGLEAEGFQLLLRFVGAGNGIAEREGAGSVGAEAFEDRLV